MDANERLFDALVRHQIGLLRLSAGTTRRVMELLDATERDIRAELDRRVTGTLSERRKDLLIKAILSIRKTGWETTIKTWLKELRDLARAEAGFASAFIKDASPVVLDLALPSASTLAGIVNSRPFEGRVMRQWAADLQASDLRRIQDQINIGLVNGESSRDIARRVVGSTTAPGATQVTRNQAAAITRTAINHITGEVRAELVKSNADIIQEELYVATLDERTTLVCATNDNKIFAVGQGPRPPLHWNCRSLRVPLLNGTILGSRPAKPVTEAQILREYNKQNGFSAKSRGDLPRGHKGSFDEYKARRVREMTGRVSTDLSYADWLRRQSKAFQTDVLGPTRAKLFRDGELPLTKFVNRAGDDLSLRELARREAGAFRRAGLDPEKFL